MQKELKVGILGGGKVAWHLARGLHAAGVPVALVYSRTLTHAQEVAALVPNALATDSLDFTTCLTADVYLMAVADQAIPALAQAARFPNGSMVAHTSGTQPLEVFQGLAQVLTGVFYPLQTFSKEKGVDWRQVPLCIEASSKAGEHLLEQLAQKLSNQVVKMGSAQRKQLHLAAVFACNFTNHLWGIAQQLLGQAELPISLLHPLIKETMEKATLHSPFAVQTGPAQRGDTSTVQAHLQLLAADPQYQQVYQVLTQSIMAASEGLNHLGTTPN